jgi:hypothetical protein
MTNYYEWLSGIPQNGNNILAADSAQIAQLWDINNGEARRARVYARNILTYLGEAEYEEPIILPDLLKSSKEIQEYQDLLNTKQPQFLKVFPNPSRNYIIIEYTLEVPGNALIEIHQTNGIKDRKIDINNSEDQIVVDTRDWRPGIYIISLIVNEKIIESVKFVIMH